MMMLTTEKNALAKRSCLFGIALVATLMLVFSCAPDEDHELILEEDVSGELALRASSGEVFDLVETPPVPNGGYEAWIAYLSQNLIYPDKAKQDGIEGTVYLSFVVEVDGSIQGVEILRGIGGGCDEEAMRVVKNAPDWEPGKQRDQTVNVRMRVPIKFQLPEA
ncbi:energy transducer TonB [Litoribacter ruber]|uniref:Energy transducer TonB n=1 Tax=Litoribacter ruber TaxID=702568 RepID=A0AAP2CL98_9BACT|nr:MULTISPECIES: energy transducer TonB [Litoribacter]MBS9525794.1 energy transducer TonB [Litoribacter alkaliphilus]MBT0810149.1 energy transducer TonB [Litoribacter ruber]